MTLPDTFALPEGWRTYPREIIERAPGIEVLAARDTADVGFTANLTIGVQDSLGPGQIAALGAEAVRHFETHERDVVLRRREVLGEDPDAGLLQEIELTTDLGEISARLVQTQAFLPAVDPARSGQPLVRTFTCTATVEQSAALADEVAGLVQALRVAGGASA
jgi:hypothetical protein